MRFGSCLKYERCHIWNQGVSFRRALWRQLCHRRTDDPYVNHVYIVCVALALSAEDVAIHHHSISAAAYEAFALQNHRSTIHRPVATVGAYRFAGAIAPLVQWHCIHEGTAVDMMRELMHARFGDSVPSAVVWQWQLVPNLADVGEIGRRFAAAGLFPCWRGLLNPGVSVDRDPHIYKSPLIAFLGPPVR